MYFKKEEGASDGSHTAVLRSLARQIHAAQFRLELADLIGEVFGPMVLRKLVAF